MPVLTATTTKKELNFIQLFGIHHVKYHIVIILQD